MAKQRQVGLVTTQSCARLFGVWFDTIQAADPPPRGFSAHCRALHWWGYLFKPITHRAQQDSGSASACEPNPEIPPQAVFGSSCEQYSWACTPTTYTPRILEAITHSSGRHTPPFLSLVCSGASLCEGVMSSLAVGKFIQLKGREMVLVCWGFLQCLTKQFTL